MFKPKCTKLWPTLWEAAKRSTMTCALALHTLAETCKGTHHASSHWNFCVLFFAASCNIFFKKPLHYLFVMIYADTWLTLYNWIINTHVHTKSVPQSIFCKQSDGKWIINVSEEMAMARAKSKSNFKPIPSLQCHSVTQCMTKKKICRVQKLKIYQPNIFRWAVKYNILTNWDNLNISQ